MLYLKSIDRFMQLCSEQTLPGPAEPSSAKWNNQIIRPRITFYLAVLKCSCLLFSYLSQMPRWTGAGGLWFGGVISPLWAIRLRRWCVSPLGKINRAVNFKPATLTSDKKHPDLHSQHLSAFSAYSGQCWRLELISGSGLYLERVKMGARVKASDLANVWLVKMTNL